jgi:mono/diheme cytochrome c family protein
VRALARWLATPALAVIATGCGGERETPAPEPAPVPDAGSAPPAPAIPSPEPSPEPAEAYTPDATRGAARYAALCASCHGARGGGDGPLAASLDPRPAAHNNGAVMNALSDDYLFKVIVEGGPAVGKSPLMAPWGGTLSDEDVRDVIAFIRTLADPPYVPPSG